MEAPIQQTIPENIPIVHAPLLKELKENEDTLPRHRRAPLAIYFIVTAFTFVLLVLTPQAGVSVPIFVLLQGAMLWRVKPPNKSRKHLLLLIPIFLLALNPFISANTMWHGASFIVSALLFGLMQVWAVHGLSFQNKTYGLLEKLIFATRSAFKKIPLPFTWGVHIKAESRPMVRRVIIGALASVPVLIFLIIMLSMADPIFFRVVDDIFLNLARLISFSTIWRIIFGTLAGLYMFGVVYGITLGRYKYKATNGIAPITGDCVILNVVLSSALMVYTLFVAIQFRYLFASPDSLPYGLTFANYARRGFFELLFLTAINVGFMLVTIAITKTQKGRGAKITKALCLYLCMVTVVLLISSFYRMWLYSSDDGLTRMRFLVFGFLIFQGVGLIFTCLYILRPRFNIVTVYALIALCYFITLNLIPMDRLIAREQINRYLAGERTCAAYVLSLSPDAAPEIKRLLNSPNPQTQAAANSTLYWMGRDYAQGNLRQWNISRRRV